MEILAFVKRVPATTAAVAIKEQKIDLNGCEFEINPYDLFAIEEGIKQKEASEGGNLTAISFGNNAVQKDLRTCLAMGADEAIQLHHEEAGNADVSATIEVLYENIKEKKFDLLLFGKQSVDTDQHGVGPGLATKLNIPCITEVTSLNIEGNKVTATRNIEGATETIKANLPCAITCQKGLNEPRLASLKGIMAAKKKTLQTIDIEMPAPKETIIMTELPPDRPEGRVLNNVTELVTALRDESKIIS